MKLKEQELKEALQNIKEQKEDLKEIKKIREENQEYLDIINLNLLSMLELKIKQLIISIKKEHILLQELYELHKIIDENSPNE